MLKAYRNCINSATTIFAFCGRCKKRRAKKLWTKLSHRIDCTPWLGTWRMCSFLDEVAFWPGFRGFFEVDRRGTMGEGADGVRAEGKKWRLRGGRWRGVGEVWRGVERWRGVWRGAEEYVKVWRSMQRCREVWRGAEEYGEVWRSVERSAEGSKEVI